MRGQTLLWWTPPASHQTRLAGKLQGRSAPVLQWGAPGGPHGSPRPSPTQLFFFLLLGIGSSLLLLMLEWLVMLLRLEMLSEEFRLSGSGALGAKHRADTEPVAFAGDTVRLEAGACCRRKGRRHPPPCLHPSFVGSILPTSFCWVSIIFQHKQTSRGNDPCSQEAANRRKTSTEPSDLGSSSGMRGSPGLHCPPGTGCHPRDSLQKYWLPILGGGRGGAQGQGPCI